MGALYFFQIKYIDTQDILCKNISPETTKNDNGDAAIRDFFATQMEPTTP